MVRRAHVGLALLAVVLVAMGALLQAPIASAINTCSPITSSTCPHNVNPNTQSVKNLYGETGTGYTTDAISASSTEANWSAANDTLLTRLSTAGKAARMGVWRGRIAANVLPRLGTMGDIGLAVGAFDLGWHIGGALNRYLNLFGQFGSDNAIYNSTAFPGVGWSHARWHWEDCSAGTTHVTNGVTLYDCVGGGVGSPVQGLVAVFQTDLGGGYGDLNTYDCNTVGQSIFGGASTCRDYQVELNQRYLHGNSAGLPGTLYNMGPLCCVSGNSENTYMRVMTETQGYGATTDVQDSPYTGQSSGTTTSQPSGAETVDNTELANGNAAAESTNGGTGAQWIDSQLDPTTSDDPTNPPIALPQPNPNETYSDYTTRLMAAGWLGTITTDTALDPYDSGYGPDSVVRLRIKNATGTTTIDVLDPLSWPVTATYPANDQVEITPNPSDAPPVGTTGGGTCSGYLTATPDFSPLNIDVGSKFPFGTFGYLYDVIAPFGSVTPVTPSVDWTLHLPHVAGGPYHFQADAHNLDGYMSYIRTLIAFALVIAAVYLIATSFLKIGIGNPGASAADADDPGALTS